MVLYIFDVFIIWTIANIISKIVVIIGWVILSIWLKREFRLCTLLTKKHSKILYNAIWNYVKNETVTNMMTTSSQSILYFQTKDDWNHNAEFASMHRVYSHVHEGWNDSVELSVKFCTSNFVHQFCTSNFWFFADHKSNMLVNHSAKSWNKKFKYDSWNINQIFKSLPFP